MVIGRVAYVLSGSPSFDLSCLLPLPVGAAGVQASWIVVILPGIRLWLPFY